MSRLYCGCRLDGGPGGIEDLLVVRLLGDVRHIFTVDDDSLPVDYERRAGIDAQVLDLNTVLLAEIAIAEIGERLHVADTFGSAPAGLGERRVDADDQHDHIITQCLCLLVEAPGLDRADGGVERWDR